MTAILNFIFKEIRIRKAVKHIKDNSMVLDIGSGLDAKMLLMLEPRIKKGIGLDYRASKFKSRKIAVKKFIVKDRLPYRQNSFDHITMLAMIEHLKHPEKIAKECHRILRKGGSLIITCPTPRADRLLHVLLKIPLVFSDEEEATKHEKCFRSDELGSLLANAGFKKVMIKPFELGLNTLAVAYK